MKMMKRVCSLLFAVAMLLSVAVLSPHAEITSLPRVIDDSDLLTDKDEAALSAKLTEYSEEQNCDITILLVDDLSGADFSYDGSSEGFVEEYYDSHGYSEDGVMVMLVQSNEYGKRHICISSAGKCRKRLNEDEREAIIDDAAALIPSHDLGKNADFYPTLDRIADDINEMLPPHLKWYMLPLAIAIGFVIAMLIMSSIRKKLKTVAMQCGAANYIRMGSMNITQSRDTYLYSTVSRTRREKNDSNSHTSSTHSTSGRDI